MGGKGSAIERLLHTHELVLVPLHVPDVASARAPVLMVAALASSRAVMLALTPGPGLSVVPLSTSTGMAAEVVKSSTTLEERVKPAMLSLMGMPPMVSVVVSSSAKTLSLSREDRVVLVAVLMVDMTCSVLPAVFVSCVLPCATCVSFVIIITYHTMPPTAM